MSNGKLFFWEEDENDIYDYLIRGPNRDSPFITPQEDFSILLSQLPTHGTTDPHGPVPPFVPSPEELPTILPTHGTTDPHGPVPPFVPSPEELPTILPTHGTTDPHGPVPPFVPSPEELPIILPTRGETDPQGPITQTITSSNEGDDARWGDINNVVEFGDNTLDALLADFGTSSESSIASTAQGSSLEAFAASAQPEILPTADVL